MASVLDTFVLLFKSDVTGAQKPVEQTDKAVQELDESVKDASKSVGEMDGGMGKLGATVGKAIAAFLAIDAVINGVFANSDRINSINDFSQSIGENTVEVEAWSSAAAAAGGDGAAFQATLENLSKQAQIIATKGKSGLSPFLEDLGVSLVDATGKARSMLDVLPELADKFAQMDARESRGFGEKLGLDQGTILLLQQGRRAVEDMVAAQKELSGTTQEDVDAAAALDDAMDSSGATMRGLFVTMATAATPAITGILNAFSSLTQFVKENKSFVLAFFGVITAAILYAYLPAMVSAAIATWATVAPFLAVAAAVAAAAAVIALIVDDVYNFVKGNDSAIGSLLKFITTSEIFKAAVQGISDAFTWVSESVQTFIGWIEKALDLYGKFKEFVGDAIGGTVSAAVEMGQGALAMAGGTPLNSQTATSVSTSSRQVSKDQSVNIQTLQVQTQASDADGISRSIGVSLKGQMREAVSNFDDGVDN